MADTINGLRGVGSVALHLVALVVLAKGKGRVRALARRGWRLELLTALLRVGDNSTI